MSHDRFVVGDDIFVSREDFLDHLNFTSDREMMDAMIEAAAQRVRAMLLDESLPSLEKPKLERQKRRRSPLIAIRKPKFI